MKVLVISDVHGNLPALEIVLHKNKDVDLIISLGDVVNYGPWSNECVELLQTQPNCIKIMGNHEEAFIAGNYLGTNEVAKAFFEFCYPKFNQNDVLKTYVEFYQEFDYTFIHTIQNMYVYSDTIINIDRNYCIGHSHRQFIKTINNYQLINVGSVGQNRININEINYALFDTNTKIMDLKKLNFNSNALIFKMKDQGYPDICLNYILSKQKI